MTDPYLTIESDAGIIESNEISHTGVGVEVRPGVTGLGLPAVSLQFDENAGDGARYRGRRLSQRSLDIKFHIYGPDRASLRETLDRVVSVIAERVKITFHDPDASEEWTTYAYRSGGGDYSYGSQEDLESTDGESWVDISVTFVTESPYWELGQPTLRTIGASGNVSLTNTGTAPAAPVWKITGPSLGFKATSSKGEVLWFQGLIDAATTVTIDCGNGTVTDNHGNNRYNDLGPSPRFFGIPPGNTAVAVALDQLSSQYADAYSIPRVNLVTNPNFVDIAGWTLTGFTYDAVNTRVVQDTTLTTSRPKISTTCTGLTPGNNYVVFINGSMTRGTYGPQAVRKAAMIEVIDGGIKKNRTLAEGESIANVRFEFTAESNSVTLNIYPEAALKKNDTYDRSIGWFDKAFLGTPGPYFDGDTPDTPGLTYSWSGTTNRSFSRATPVTLPTAGSSVLLSYKPRREAVI